MTFATEGAAAQPAEPHATGAALRPVAAALLATTALSALAWVAYLAPSASMLAVQKGQDSSPDLRNSIKDDVSFVHAPFNDLRGPC